MGYAIRSLLREKSFVLIALVTLGLGIGANTAIFSVVNGVLLRPLSYSEPERLYLARTVAPALSHVASHLPVNPRHFHEWRTAGRSFEEVALAGGIGLTLTGVGETERLPGLQVSANFFQTLGVQPAIGRDFLPSEELPGSTRVVMLSDSLWRRRFAAEPAVIGRAIRLNGEPHVVVGVLAPGVPFPKGEQWGPLFAHSLDPLIPWHG